MMLFDSMVTPEEQELQWYVDRDEVLDDFAQRLNGDARAISKVIVYQGLGGVGKTSIRRMAEERFLKPHRAPYAIVYYEPESSPRSPEGTFADIRHQLGRFGLKFPRFDTIWSIHWEATTRQRLPKTDLPAEIGAAASLISVIPIVGPVLGNIPQALIGAAELTQSAAEWISKRYQGGVTRLQQMDALELLHQMPQALAQDLEDMVHNHDKLHLGANFRIAVIFDGFERLAEKEIDDWFVREFCRSTASTLKVIFGREVIHWENYDPTWKDFIDHYQLSNLTSRDADEYLQRRSLHNPNIRKYISEQTDGFPLHLRLSADTYRKIEGRIKREPTIADFVQLEQAGDVEKTLYTSLLREVAGDERHAAILAAIPRWFNQEILEVLLAEPASAPHFFQLLAYFSFSERAPISEDAYIMRKEARQLLRERARRMNNWIKWNSRLVDYHKQRRSNFLHLTEELYHKFITDPQGALQLFRSVFYRYIEMERFGDCLTLLGAIPPEAELPAITVHWLSIARAELLQKDWRTKDGTKNAELLLSVLMRQKVPARVRARAFRLSGMIHASLGDRQKAIDLMNQAISMFDSLGEPLMKAATFRDVGRQYFLMGNYHDALRSNKQALNLAKRIRQVLNSKDQSLERVAMIAEAGFTDRPLTYILKRMAGVYARTGRAKLAIKPLQTMLKEGQEIGNLRQQAEALSELGLVYRRLGYLKEAKSAYHKVIPLQEQLGSVSGHANALCGLGMSLEQEGHFELASPHYVQALELFEQANDMGGKAKALVSLARVEQQRNNTRLALHFYEMGFQLFRDIGLTAHIGNNLLSFAKLKTSMGEHQQAIQFLQEALSIFGGLEDRAGEVATHTNLGIVYYMRNEPNHALTHWKQAHSLYMRMVSGHKLERKGRSVKNIGIRNPEEMWVSNLAMYDRNLQKQTLTRLTITIRHLQQDV